MANPVTLRSAAPPPDLVPERTGPAHVLDMMNARLRTLGHLFGLGQDEVARADVPTRQTPPPDSRPLWMRPIAAPRAAGVPTAPVSEQQAPVRSVAPQAPASFQLKRNDTGAQVLELQKLLYATGFFYETPDGNFGKSTERAVADFQTNYVGPDGLQLRIDGVAGETTLQALRARKAVIDARRQGRGAGPEAPPTPVVAPTFERLGEVQVLKPGAHGTEVARAKTLLGILGYQVAAGDQYDATTQAAVADFQDRYSAINGVRLDAKGVLAALTGRAMRDAAESTRESPITWLEFARRIEDSPALPAPAEPEPNQPTPPPVSPSAPYAGSPVLRAGTTDKAQTQYLQNQLRGLGYAIDADGSFGIDTTTALADFQRLYSLFTGEAVAAEGVYNDQTRLAMADALNKQMFKRLPAPLQVGELVTGYVRGVPQRFVVRQLGDGGHLESRAALAYFAMRSTANKSGIDFRAASSFRTMQKQVSLAREYSAYYKRAATPGYSTHQTGIAVDTDTNKHGHTWLTRNAGQYGFILPGYAYGLPGGGTSIEDWHWEYRTDRVPNAVRAFYGMPTLRVDPQPTAAPVPTRQARPPARIHR